MSLSDAAKSLKVAPVTLRAAIKRGRLEAKKFGKDWGRWPVAVERYRRESLGQPGRKAAA